MPPIPTAPSGLFFEKLYRWYSMTADLAKLKTEEILLRKEIFGEAFPVPVEGTSYFDLPDGYRLQARYDLDRKIDAAMLVHMRDALANIGVAIDPLLNWKVELKTANYKLLADEARTLFDNIITTSPSTPQLKIIAPVKDDVDVRMGATRVVEEATPVAVVKKTRKPRAKKVA